MHERIDVDFAFDPEKRQAQRDFDAYLNSRPVEDDAGKIHNPDNGQFINAEKYFEQKRTGYYDETLEAGDYSGESLAKLAERVAEARRNNDKTMQLDAEEVFFDKFAAQSEKYGWGNEQEGKAGRSTIDDRLERFAKIMYGSPELAVKDEAPLFDGSDPIEDGRNSRATEESSKAVDASKVDNTNDSVDDTPHSELLNDEGAVDGEKKQDTLDDEPAVIDDRTDTASGENVIEQPDVSEETNGVAEPDVIVLPNGMRATVRRVNGVLTMSFSEDEQSKHEVASHDENAVVVDTVAEEPREKYRRAAKVGNFLRHIRHPFAYMSARFQTYRAMNEEDRSTERGRWGRRALVGAIGVAAITGAVIAAKHGMQSGSAHGVATGVEGFTPSGNTGSQIGAAAGIAGGHLPASAHTHELANLTAFNIPKGSGGEALMGRLGVPKHDWYQHQNAFLSRFPKEAYRMPDGNVGFRHPGKLSSTAIKFWLQATGRK